MKKQTVTVVITTIITVLIVLVGLALLMPTIGPRFLHPMMMGGNDSPGFSVDKDTSTTGLTEQGLFRVSYTSDKNPLPLNQIHSWKLHIETADGQPVDNAQISVDGGMPQHGHGLPTRPQITENLGGGDYRMEGVRFQMLGWWEVRLTINANGQSDSITFNIILE